MTARWGCHRTPILSAQEPRAEFAPSEMGEVPNEFVEEMTKSLIQNHPRSSEARTLFTVTTRATRHHQHRGITKGLDDMVH